MKDKPPLLGLAVSALSLAPGQVRELRHMAAFCHAAGEQITWQRLHQIEQAALRKLRIRIKLTPEECEWLRERRLTL